MGRARYQADELTPEQDAIVHLVRLGLAGDTGSIRHLTRRMLRAGGLADAADQRFRETLGKTLADTASPARAAVAHAAPPIDPETNMPLIRVDEVDITTTPILNAPESAAVELFLEQRLNTEALAQAGLEPPRSMLLQGPPGVGKTLTARHIAHELGLPLIDVELPAVVSSFLGRTGQNLRQLLDHARAAPSVLLLDEFDALAKRRDDQSDVGELKRLVNVLLLELERWPVESVLIAATNHPQLLDPAATRRFDFTVTIELPEAQARHAILHQALLAVGADVSDSLVRACALVLEGETGAALTARVDRAARTAVIQGVDIGYLLADGALAELRETSDLERRGAFSVLASEALGLSNREIAKMLGVSHPTVAKLIRQSRQAAVQLTPEANDV